MTNSAFRSALEDILKVSRGVLRDSDSRDTIETWSSLADVQITVLLSSELGVEADAEIMEAETIGQLLSVLEGREVFD
jgi:hypothetical protein